MICSAQTLRKIKPVVPFVERAIFEGMTYGLGPCGYDISIREDVVVGAGQFALASSIEEFYIPNDIMGVVHDKSTWARRGLAVQNTVLEPGWKGFLTLELTNHHVMWHDPGLRNDIHIKAGSPIAQVVFHMLDRATDIPYRGKYQNQPEGPQPAIFERVDDGLKMTGTLCSMCRQAQYESPAGITCVNGHGGADAIEEA